jgi:diguanylate cyclase (GGDEF)-like protein
MRKSSLFFMGRFGGDEFLIVLWNMPRTNAVLVAERIRDRIEKHSFVYEGNKISITSSIGLDCLFLDKRTSNGIEGRTGMQHGTLQEIRLNK